MTSQKSFREFIANTLLLEVEANYYSLGTEHYDTIKSIDALHYFLKDEIDDEWIRVEYLSKLEDLLEDEE